MTAAPATTPNEAPSPASGGSDPWITSDRIFLALLVIFVPAAIAAHFFHWGTWTFVLCAIAIVPVARLMGEATEVVAHRLGPGIGGLMTASFGNAAELIIGIAALREGKVEVVKASIAGGILANLLLVLGSSVLASGIGVKKRTFNGTAALSGSAMLFLALTAILVPDIFHLVRADEALPYMDRISIAIAIILLVIYAISLIFALKTHAHLYAAEDHGTPEELPPWSFRKALVVLVSATVGIIVLAEFLVGALEPAIDSFGFTHTFVGVMVLAVVGGAAENSTAIMMAVKGKMALAFNLAFESSKLIALFVAPVLVLVSHAVGHPMSLEFSHMEVVGIAVGVGAASLIALDGESNWLEGVMLLGVYAILGVAFFYIP